MTPKLILEIKIKVQQFKKSKIAEIYVAQVRGKLLVLKIGLKRILRIHVHAPVTGHGNSHADTISVINIGNQHDRPELRIRTITYVIVRRH